MKYRFFRIPLSNAETGEAELNAFCAQNRIVQVDKHFVSDGGNSCWAFCVTWLDKTTPTEAARQKSGKVDYREVLNDADFASYVRLRELRKSIAEREGTPAYNVFTNEQLAAMVTGRLVSKAELLELPGVGQSRVDRYAEPFLNCLKSLFAESDASKQN